MILDNSPSQVLQYAMVALGLGSMPVDGDPWPIFATSETPTPDNQIVIFDTSGILDGRLQQTGEQQEFPGIQIKVRATDPIVGYVRIQDIAANLDAVCPPYPVAIGLKNYHIWNISRKGTILRLGKETPTSKREIFTVNMTITLRQIADTTTTTSTTSAP